MRSILAKLSLANEFRLGGLSYWTINQYFPQNWLVQNSVYDVQRCMTELTGLVLVQSVRLYKNMFFF